MESRKLKIEIPLKLPSLNEYIGQCRSNRYAGANMKRQVERNLSWYINTLPTLEKPVRIHFRWIEGNKKRDIDNVAFGKKFILDCLVKCGKLKNDNTNYVKGFTDTFEYGKEFKIILEIEELEE
jgi:Holliday junction resolvase RusA-like endonuclease